MMFFSSQNIFVNIFINRYIFQESCLVINTLQLIKQIVVLIYIYLSERIEF